MYSSRVPIVNLTGVDAHARSITATLSALTRAHLAHFARQAALIDRAHSGFLRDLALTYGLGRDYDAWALATDPDTPRPFVVMRAISPFTYRAAMPIAIKPGDHPGGQP